MSYFNPNTLLNLVLKVEKAGDKNYKKNSTLDKTPFHSRDKSANSALWVDYDAGNETLHRRVSQNSLIEVG